jgi:hypothetical protein
VGEQRLTSPRVTILREGGEPITVQTNNRDLILWDRTRLRHKWPRMDEAPNLWLTFISWAAARRTGAIPAELRYEAWEAEVIDVTPQTDDDDSDEGRPFPEEAEPGSS